MFELYDIRVNKILEIKELKFPTGQISCIIGPSGAGKSTLLELLNNLLSPDEGTIFYQGQQIEQLDPIQLRREVIMLPQQPVIFAGTVKENLVVGFELTDTETPTDDNLREMLELVQLPVGLNDDAAQLSGGEQQRLSLARSLLLDPEVLLLDEPSSALDEATEELVIEQIVDYARSQDKTLIMVTHSTDIADKYGDKIVTLKDGRLKQEEPI